LQNHASRIGLRETLSNTAIPTGALRDEFYRMLESREITDDFLKKLDLQEKKVVNDFILEYQLRELKNKKNLFRLRDLQAIQRF
jgi:hypothetical protein